MYDVESVEPLSGLIESRRGKDDIAPELDSYFNAKAAAAKSREQAVG
jgi:uncharacterized protein YehS (DUF1456 family)